MVKIDPQEDARSPGNVILEDLDRVEAERESRLDKPSLKRLVFPGREGDVLLWRKLFGFARPYLFKIFFCLFLSTVVGAATAGKLWFIKAGLEPMVNPETIQTDPFEDVKEKFKAFKEGAARWIPFVDAPDETSDEPEPKDEEPDEAEAQPASVEKGQRDFNPEYAKNRLILVVIILMLVVLFEQSGRYIQNVMIRGIGHRIIMDIRNALFARVMSFSLKFHNKNHSGKLISRLTNDLQVFGNFFTHTAVQFTVDIFTLLGCIIYLYLEGGYWLVAILAVISLAFLPIQAIGRRIRRRDKITQRSTSTIYSALSESLTGQKIIKAFTTEDYEYEKFRQVSAKTYRNTMKSARLRSRTQPIVELTGALVLGAMVLILGYQVINQHIAFAAMASVVTAMVLAIGPVRRQARAYNNIMAAMASADRVATLLYSEPEIQDKAGAAPLKSFEKKIRYEDVSFEHDQGIPVLKDISLEICKGEVVALVGPSGSGKTTMVDLVPRFYDVIKGRITIDGTDIRELNIRSLRNQIGIVSQESILFNDTVRMNIAYGIPEASMDSIKAAAKVANAHEFILELEDGYDTLIGERGVRLSGGQKQRIAIARAILKNPPILILDEATSSLDSESELQVQEALSRLMEGRTTLVIAHRLSTIRGADKIAVINENRVVEFGRHEELLKLGRMYAKLYELQTNGPDVNTPARGKVE
ncbi:MAG: ABC transporter ATP-binding protein [Planctomycetota bacterium]|jgi:subfamily B ATP-binding cassette protein MsbA